MSVDTAKELDLVPKGTNPKQVIELGCAPGGIRPGDIIGKVIAGTGLPDRSDCGRFFGSWTWDYSDIHSNDWARIQPIIKERIETMYHSGRIRYGSW